jgi:hypothetical protein
MNAARHHIHSRVFNLIKKTGRTPKRYFVSRELWEEARREYCLVDNSETKYRSFLLAGVSICFR